MKHPVPTKLLSLFLAIALLIGCCPFAYAAEDEGAAEPVVITAETEAEETTEAAEATEATEPTEATEETQATEATEETEATEATEATEETQGTEATEETVAELLECDNETKTGDLPYGLKGLPEDYVLSAAELEAKQNMAAHDVCAVTDGLTPGVDYAEGEVIISADSREQAEIYAAAFNAELKSFDYGIAVLGLSDVSVPEAVTASADMDLALPAVYPNHIIRIEPVDVDTKPSDQSSLMAVPQQKDWESTVREISDPFLQNPAADNYQYMHDVVDSYAAWGVTTGNAIKVAVVDSGVKADHPDLAGKVISINAGRGTGDNNGHGTHVAGIIAAAMGNSRGGAGIAPNAKILGIRVEDSSGSIKTSYVIAGINAAVSNGAKVINLSLGGYFYNGDYEKAVTNAIAKDVCVVAAMGNDGGNIVCYPAAFPGVIAVGASDRANNRAFFSNWGPWQDVSAPGYGILSTSKDGTDGYEFMNGTSQATPVVSGVVALYRSVHPEATPAQVEARLKATATKAGKNMGAGIVNAAKMLSDKPPVPGAVITQGSSAVASSTGSSTATVPCESKLSFFTNFHDNEEYILYTLDGTKPAVKDGQVVNGIEYQNPISLSQYAGKTITVKAIQVNGLGMAGQMLSYKVTVKYTESISGVKVTSPGTLMAGKSVQLTAVVEPAATSSQAVTWEIVTRSDNMAKATISAAGVLKVPGLSAGQSGWVTIQASAKANPDKKSEQRQIEVKPLTPVAKMVMSQKKVSVFTDNTVPLSCTALDKTGNPLMPDVAWVSSNPEVATVDNTGLVTGLAKGTVTITCKALDGSGKSAKSTVTVTKPVTDITISGQSDVYCGSSAPYKVEVLPADASNKAVEWYLKDAPAGVTIDQKGIVKVSGTADGFKAFYVCAKAKDGSGQEAEMLVWTVSSSVKSHHVSIWVNPGQTPVEKTNLKGKLSSVTLYTVDIPNRSGNETTVQLNAAGFDAREDECVCGKTTWTTSNPSIASIEVMPDGSCWVTGHKAGTVKITATATDGSKRKATVTIKVLVPASSISILARNDRIRFSDPYLAYGKSADNKVVFADTYGKPTNQKVTWSFMAVDTDRGDITALVKNKKWISISSRGKLSVNAKMMKEYWVNTDGEVTVTVTATTTDGTNVSASVDYFLVPPASGMTMGQKSTTAARNGVATVRFASNQWFAFGNASSNWDFTFTSSNPKVAGVAKEKGIVTYLGRDSKYGHVYQLKIYTGNVAGSAKITIKTTDGTNKSCSVTVKVK